MKILIATGIYPPDIGGPATYSKSVNEAMSTKGHMVCVAVFTNITKRWPKGLSHLVYFLHVLWMSRDADIVYAQDPVSVGIPALFAARIMRKKFVVRIAGDYAWEQGVGRYGVKELLDDFLRERYGFRVELLRRCERLVARRADIVIVPSKYLKQVVMRWGLKKVRIEVIFSVARTESRVSKIEARKKLNLDGVVLVSAGRFVSWKGFGMLIELMPKLLPAKLIILGDGPDRMDLETLRDRLKLAHSVLLPGVVSKEVSVQYLTAADVFLLNTGYEGFSHQLLEAMVAGVPVVTTNAGGNKELVENNINALFAGYNNISEWETQVKKILNDHAFAEKITHEASRRVSAYTLEHMIEKLITVFESL